MRDEMPYENIPEPPETLNGAGILVRLVDSVAFRYRWSTEGLREEDVTFTPGMGCMTMREILVHILLLANAALQILQHGQGEGWITEKDADRDWEIIRRQTLGQLDQLRSNLLSMPDEQLAAIRVSPEAPLEDD